MDFVDSHCHLPLIESATRSVTDFIDAARVAGVRHLLCVSVDLETFPQIAALAAVHPGVFASIGVHPNSETNREEATVARLLAGLRDPNVIAIGETGLDYFRQSGDLAWQHERFRVHIRAAIEGQRPLIIHTREAAADVIRILREEHAERIGGVMHCFVEDWDTASAAMDLGFYISFTGIVTFKSATQVQDVARRVPRERLLIETDAPWLAPVPHRGKSNEPAYVRHTAEYLAQLRGEAIEDLARVTTANFFRLFTAARRTSSPQ